VKEATGYDYMICHGGPDVSVVPIREPSLCRKEAERRQILQRVAHESLCVELFRIVEMNG
jgi:hypothetical protein